MSDVVNVKAKPATALYRVTRDGLLYGYVQWTEWPGDRQGWRFMPMFHRQPSRRLFDTPEKAIRMKNVTLVAA